jgi:predicted RNA binding protein YcfA (HicA-like mRNA interferase family)
MSQLPQVPGQRLIRALQRAGFIVLRQAGGHAILRHVSDLSRRAIVPVHGSYPIKPGTLRAILKGANLTPEDLRELL